MLRVMIIGATWEQIPLIQEAKKLGGYVLATSISKEDEGLAYADEVEIVDPRKLTRVLEIAKSFRPDGITADECDYSHFAAVVVSECLGLSNDGLVGAQSTTNKLWMREACRAHHVLQPRFIGCRTMADAKNAVELIGWPVIVKPVDNRGAFGVKVVNSKEELYDAYLEALMTSHSREVIVEAYVEGLHITVDGCVDQEGRHHNLAIASKQLTEGNKPIIIQVNYPARITDEQEEYVLTVNQQVVDALNINAGLTHSEYILDSKGRCFLVETANRGGGVYTSAKIVPAMSGVNLSQLLISNAIGVAFDFEIKKYVGEVILKFFIFQSGRVASIDGVDVVSKMEGVECFKLLVEPGDELSTPKSGAERHGFVILKATDSAAIEKLYCSVMETIRVNYE